jgi:hypothetical protein
MEVEVFLLGSVELSIPARGFSKSPSQWFGINVCGEVEKESDRSRGIKVGHE